MFQHKRFWGLLIVSVIFTPWGWRLLDTLWQPMSWMHWLKQSGPWQPIVFIATNCVVNTIGVPGTLLVVVGGAVFGLAWGTLWSLIGATLGAIGAFGLSRYLLHGWFVSRFSHHPQLLSCNRLMDQQGLLMVLTIRFAPLAPFNLINFLLGLTAVRPPIYALGTFIGIIPGTFAYTWLGASGQTALQGKGSIALIMSLTLLTLLSLMPIWLARRQRAKS
jgi:uncharacterized membrane protein YdjX (TVP38/TMEM64 family)